MMNSNYLLKCVLVSFILAPPFIMISQDGSKTNKFGGISSETQDQVSLNIMELGRSNNLTMQHLDILTNRIGGRLSGSDAYNNAVIWISGLLESWGLDVELQEAGSVPVGFNRGPWFGKMIVDSIMHLDFVTPSYTSGTRGSQQGHVVIEPRSYEEYKKIEGKLKGAWVLIEGRSFGDPIDYSSAADKHRRALIECEDTAKIANEPALFYKEMRDAGILGIIQSAPTPLVAIYDKKNMMEMTFDSLPKTPDIKLNESQYKLIRDKVENDELVILEFDIRNYFKPGPVVFHNVIAQIKGTEYPDEYVLSGCHLDSYDVASGAIDCGSGVAPNLEMARLIMAAGGDMPKRTILFCFWGAEEYGLLGSLRWLEENEDKWGSISNYFNRDGGPTAASGLKVPENWYEDIKRCTEGLEEYHPRIRFTVEKSNASPSMPAFVGNSDHSYFGMFGIPTISFENTDPLDYDFDYGEVWHTNKDLFNKSISEYMEYTSVIQAVTIFNIANLDHLLPRSQIYIE